MKVPHFLGVLSSHSGVRCNRYENLITHIVPIRMMLFKNHNTKALEPATIAESPTQRLTLHNYTVSVTPVRNKRSGNVDLFRKSTFPPTKMDLMGIYWYYVHYN